MEHVALIGFGEAAQAFATAKNWAANASIYDRKTDDVETRGEKVAEITAAGVHNAGSLGALAADAKLILSLVTADQALSVAQSCARHLRAGTLYCDGNSVAPETKRCAAELINEAGGQYVDVAIMSPVYPSQLDVPLLLSGGQAHQASRSLAGLGFGNIRVVGDQVGRASTIKILRSVMYKGVEALTAECLIACQKAGVTEEVLGSFGNDWSSGADYRLDRMMVHGLRRAAEMEEAVKALHALGVEPLMTMGTANRQRQIGVAGIDPVPETLSAKLKRLVP